MNVVIGIGYDGTTRPNEFRNQVERVITRQGSVAAVIEGKSSSDPWGTEDGAWFAAEFPSFDAYVEARARILAVGAAHNQDAIAFTVGTVDVAACPKPKVREYRHLL